jgi:hypothetical protein
MGGCELQQRDAPDGSGITAGALFGAEITGQPESRVDELLHLAGWGRCGATWPSGADTLPSRDVR